MMSMAGEVYNSGDGPRLKLNCPMCKSEHDTALTALEQPVKLDGKEFLYWTKCPKTLNIIMLRPRGPQGIGVAFTPPPVGYADPEGLMRT